MRLNIIVLLLIALCSCRKEKNNVVPAASYSGQKVVIIGSSIASGVGATSYDNSWPGLMALNNAKDTFINYSVSGYLTFHFLPYNFPNSPIRADTNVNINAVMKTKPGAVIISITTNDIASGYTPARYLANMKVITDTLEKYKIKYLITSTTLRGDISHALNDSLLTLAGKIKSSYPKSYIEIISLIADTVSLTPNPQLYNSDKIHPNNSGHRILFNRIDSVYQKFKL
jgi:acyl-CoA thioesterase I